MDALEKSKKTAEILDSKKATDIRILEVGELTGLAEYFVICSCTSNVHLRACADELEEKLAELGIHPIHKDGYRAGGWIALDFADVIVHIFLEEMRDFYNMERLWSDARDIDF